MADPKFVMPDGSYPISTCADVSDAAKLAHNSKTYSFGEIREHVMKAKGVLGCPDSVLPDTWDQPDAEGRSDFKLPFSDGGPVSRSIVPGPGYIEPEEDGKMPHLVGNFAPYDEWAEINSSVEGHFMERHSRSAWTKSLRDNRANLRVLFHHGEDNMTGVMPLGTIERLEPAARAVDYDVALFDVDYVHRLLPALKAGQLGTSWTFHPVRDKFTLDPRPQRSSYNPKGIPEVTHHEIRLIEFGPCMFPAYAGAAAGVRSMTDYYLFSRLAKDPDQLQQLLTTVPKPSMVPAEIALSNERAEGEPHSGAESRNVPLVPVRKRFQSTASWLAWCESALK
jgi:phage head maturation protease